MRGLRERGRFITRRIIEKVQTLHESIDQKSEPLNHFHGERLQCRLGCNDCCQDDLTVFEVEAELIKANYEDLLLREMPYPRGKCAFLDERGACRIYNHRPYVCRTQGLPIRWIEEESGDWFEFRDICPKNENGPAIETLSEELCWEIGPIEQELAALQSELLPGKRVPLRGLFQTKS